MSAQNLAEAKPPHRHQSQKHFYMMKGGLRVLFCLVLVLHQPSVTITKGDLVENDESRGEELLLIREILQHVVRHPDAKDTAEGIHNFWLSRQTAHQSRDKVREILEYLVEKKGWLTKKVSGASVTLYGLNKDRMHEVESFLQQSGNDD